MATQTPAVINQINTGIVKINELLEVYQPEADEVKYLEEVYNLFQQDRNIKNESQDVLGGRTLQDIFDEADREYNIFFPDVEDDWKKNYRSLITQDKINYYWTSIYSEWIIPEVTALNKNQEVDRSFSMVAKAIMEHAEKNDGRPLQSGLMKFLRQGHQVFKYGTCFTQYNWINGRAEKEIIPNEEIFFPNFWQFDLEKQGHLIRVKGGVTKSEAEQIFGELPNWKYVKPGKTMNWSIGTTPFLRNYDSGIVKDDEVQIIYFWKHVPLKDRKKKDRPEKYFNIAINGVLMFDIENRMPFKHGLYPITKRIADLFDANYVWGKPTHLRFKSDKDAYDDFRSIIFNKGKLNALKPMVSMNGLHLDQDVLVPGKITSINDDINNLKAIQGVSDPIDGSMFNILNMLKGSIQDSATEGSKPGATKKSARQSVAEEQNVSTLQSIMALFTALDIESGAYITLRNCLQFYPRKKIERLVFTDQQLQSGRQGNLEVIFKKIPPMNQQDLLKASADIYREQGDAEDNGNPMEKAIIDPKYADEMDLFIEIQSNPVKRLDKFAKEARATNKFQLYASAGPLINQEANVRNLIREMGDNEDDLVAKQQVPDMSQMGGGQTGQDPNAQPQINVPQTSTVKSAQKVMNPVAQQFNQ